MSVFDIEILMGENINGFEEIKYVTFRETYKIITFAMGIGMIYPNPQIAKRQMKCILAMLLSIVPLSSFLIIDIYKSWLQRDYGDIIRHWTIVMPYICIFLKIFILFHKRNTAKQIIDQIDDDYASYNDLPPSHKTIVNTHLKSNLFYNEKCWSLTVVGCVLCFPGISVVLNIYNFLFKDEPTKYMVHELNIPFVPPGQQYDTPYFEFLFIYSCYSTIFYIMNFTGFDGFFGLTVNHACLKMDLYCKEFEDAMKAKNRAEIHSKLVRVIKTQNKMFEYLNLIQETFNLWLGLLFSATMIQICTCLYQLTEGTNMDPRYIIFIYGTIIHVYLPCRYSAKLKDMSMETATKLYCGGWEHVYDISVRRTVLTMIARGQTPLEITAFNLLVFDMELFVFIIKTSYSMYTLLLS